VGGEGLLQRDVTLMAKLAHASAVAAHEEAGLLRRQLAELHSRLATAELSLANHGKAFAHFKVRTRAVGKLCVVPAGALPVQVSERFTWACIGLLIAKCSPA
jgi:hypothetical protein